jgi:hypothetical protein
MKFKESRTEALRNTEGYFERLKDEDDIEIRQIWKSSVYKKEGNPSFLV